MLKARLLETLLKTGLLETEHAEQARPVILSAPGMVSGCARGAAGRIVPGWVRRGKCTARRGFGLGLLPLPVKLRAYVGPQVRFDEPPEAAADDAVVRRCHARVVQTVESMLREGLRARRSRWF